MVKYISASVMGYSSSGQRANDDGRYLRSPAKTLDSVSRSGLKSAKGLHIKKRLSVAKPSFHPLASTVIERQFQSPPPRWVLFFLVLPLVLNCTRSGSRIASDFCVGERNDTAPHCAVFSALTRCTVVGEHPTSSAVPRTLKPLSLTSMIFRCKSWSTGLPL